MWHVVISSILASCSTRRSWQFNSTAENNILREGFLADTLEEELQARPGSRVYVAVKTDDVTERVLGSVPADADGNVRYKSIETAKKELIAECEQDPGR
jgi:hypothetical protein